MAKIARQAADIDREMAELWQTAERQRRTVQHHLVTALLAKPGVHPHHDPDEIVDLVSFILGPESYWALVDQQGWPPQRWQHHAYRLLAHYLLTDGRRTSTA